MRQRLGSQRPAFAIADLLALVRLGKVQHLAIQVGQCLALAKGNGLELIKRVKARGDTVRMLAWSMYSERLYAERALNAGALGFISKE